MTLLIALLLLQAPPVSAAPAVRRTTPLTADPGMVVRQAGNVNVNQGPGVYGDGGTWAVTAFTPGTVDTGNSTTTPLAGGGIFTGAGVDTLHYAGISVLVYANVSSATSGVRLQFSSDNVNWDDATVGTFTAGDPPPNAGQVWAVAPRGRYFRVVYVNGAAAQATFRLSTVLQRSNPSGDAMDIENTILDHSHALVTKTIIGGHTTAGGGGYVDVKVNPSGALAADVTQATSPWLVAARDGGHLTVQQGINTTDGGYLWNVWDPKGNGLNSTAITAGYVPGVTVQLIYGRNPDINTGSLPEDLWAGGGVYTGFPMGGADGGPTAEPFEIFSSDVNDTGAGTGAQQLYIEGLNVNYGAVSETVTLNGVTPVDTVNSYTRLRNAYVTRAGSLTAANAGIITVRHTTTVANVFAAIPIGTNQNYVGAFTVPAGKTAYMKSFSAQMYGGGAGRLQTVFWIREQGYPPRLRRPYDLTDGIVLDDPIHGGLQLPAGTDIILRAIAGSAANASLNAHYDVTLIDN